MHKCPGVNDRKKFVIDKKISPIYRTSATNTIDHSCVVLCILKMCTVIGTLR